MPRKIYSPEREMQVLQLMADDMTSEEIGEALNLSDRTVEIIAGGFASGSVSRRLAAW